MTLTDHQFDELQNKLENIPPDDIGRTYMGKTLAGVELVSDDIDGIRKCCILMYFTDGEDSEQILALTVEAPAYTGLKCPPLMFGTASLTIHEQRADQ